MDLSDLNAQQQLAVTETLEDNSLVIAGAGAGKTRVLTTRVAYLLDEKNVEPEQIMVVTFTNKATRELKERIKEVCIDYDKLTIGTFHGICMQILKEFGDELAPGVSDFTMLTAYESKGVLREVMQNLGHKYDKATLNKYASQISSYKNKLVSPKTLLAKASNQSELSFATVYREYQNTNWRRRTFDFDDLLVYTVTLLTKSQVVLEYFDEKIKYIMCDEAQDTNEIQFTLLRILAGGDNLFLVGDDSQSIYRWRGAKPEYILDFANIYPDSKVLKLDQNYRSTKTIVEASNELVNNNTVKYEKTCFSNNAKGSPILVHSLYDNEEEANWIADEIKSSISSAKDLSDICVLYRVNSSSRPIEDAFMRKGIPYKLIGSTSFYDRKEVRDILSFVKFIANNKDVTQFKRALGLMPGIGKKTVENIISGATVGKMNLVEAAANYTGGAKITKGLASFVQIIKMGPEKPSELISFIAKETGITESLINEDTEDSKSRLQNILELVNIAETKELENDKYDIKTFVDEISLMSSSDKDSESGSVNLMTIHSAKGLEFDTVFITGLEEGMLPHSNSLNSEEQIEEERRLMYVAMTRAKNTLYITRCRNRISDNKMYSSKESRFLKEIPEKYTMSLI